MLKNIEESESRFSADALIDFATKLLVYGGLEENRAKVVAETLTQADLMGHSTHGLQLLAPYVEELEKGDMTKAGEPEAIQDRGSAVTWDGKYLPGPWLVHKAIDLALERVAEHPVATIVIQRSHHIGCLATYPERATRHGLMMLLSCSDPRNRSVAPYGGIRAVYSPNPIAAGIPAQNEPIIFDISTSTTANGLIVRTHNEGKRLKHKWLLDCRGNPTDDPSEFFEDPPATILPLGGLDAGYKGFALGLLVEALTSGLCGFGRASLPNNWGASVFLQIIDPEAFGGRQSFVTETEYLAEKCSATLTRPDDPPVRLPGRRALKLRQEQLHNGVRLYPAILPAVKKCAEKHGVPFPKPMASE